MIAGKDPGKATEKIKGNSYLSFKDRLKILKRIKISQTGKRKIKRG